MSSKPRKRKAQGTTETAEDVGSNLKKTSSPKHGEKKVAKEMSFYQRCLKSVKYIILLILIPPFLNYAALQQEGQKLQPPGLLYDIGLGHKLFLACEGSGSPTVILDAPTGMTSDAWSLIYPELATVTKVCVYDRAGLGFSERPQSNYSIDETDQVNNNRWQEFTVERMVDDFRRLFTQSSQQERPFILVGAEMGALVARFYTQIYESDVSDLVLIDPLTEDLFTYDDGIWSHLWFGQLLPSFQAMQLSAATGLTRLALLVNMMNPPFASENIPEEVILRQKYLMCNPRHISSVVDEHHFINETFSQMQLMFSIKSFPSNVSVTVINGNYFDEQLPSALNKAWAKSQQNLISSLHPGSTHLVVNGADRHMLFRDPRAVIEPLKRLVKQRRAKAQREERS